MYRELQSFPRQRRATSSSMLIALLLASTASTGALAQGLDPNAGFQDDYSDVIDDQTLPEEAPLDDGTPITDVAPPPEAYAAPPMAGDPAAQGYAPAPDGPGTVYRPASTLPPGLATHYRTLAPYGRWLHLPELGPVWVPDRAVVGDGFVPYSTGGEWMPTDQGSMFVARAWSWGWLPFHYGRWFRHRSLGWAWRPGSVWAPAWVRWRVGGDYIGWAPMPPAARYFANSSWVFADQDNWLGPRIHERLLPRQRWSVAFGLTTPYTRSVIYRDGRARARWYRGPEPRASWAGRYRPIRVAPPRFRTLAEVQVQPFGAAGRTVHTVPGQARFRVVTRDVPVTRGVRVTRGIPATREVRITREVRRYPGANATTTAPSRVVIRRGVVPGRGPAAAPPATNDDDNRRRRRGLGGGGPAEDAPAVQPERVPAGGHRGRVNIRYR